MDLKAMCERVAANDESFTEVHCSYRDVGPRFAAIAKALETNTVVTTVFCSCNHTGSEGAKAIGKMLAINKTLKNLFMYGNDIGDEGAKAIADGLAANASLVVLDLDRNRIGVEGIKAIAAALGAHTTLQVLSIEGSEGGLEGARALAEAISMNDTLQKLHVDDEEDTGPEGARLIADAAARKRTGGMCFDGRWGDLFSPSAKQRKLVVYGIREEWFAAVDRWSLHRMLDTYPGIPCALRENEDVRRVLLSFLG